MKRGLAVALIFILLFGSSACSGIKLTEPEDIAKGQQTAVVDPLEPGDAPDFGDFLEEEEKKEEERKQQEEQARIEKEEQGSIPPRRGSVNGGVYTNDYIGVSFSSFGFLFYNNVEMCEMVGQDPAVHTVENLASVDSPVESVYEMMAVDMQNNNVVICYDNLGKSGYASYTEAQYLRSIYMAVSEEEGYTCDWEGRRTCELGGVEFLMLPATVETNGTTMTQGYFVKKYGKYFAQIIVTAAPDAFDVILDSFGPIDG